MIRRRVAPAVCLLLAVLMSVTGCEWARPKATFSTPAPSAEQLAAGVLTEALERLATAPGVHYKGTFTGPEGPAEVKLRVARSGVAYGSMSLNRTTLRILTAQHRTFVRASKAFWSDMSSHASSDVRSRQAKLFAKRWVAVDPEQIGDPGKALRPAVLASRFRTQLAETGVSEVQQGTTAGLPVSIIVVGPTRYHVTSNKPHQLLQVDQPQLRDRASRHGNRWGVRTIAVRDPGDPSPPGDDPDNSDLGGLGFDEMEPPEIDDFYDDVDREAKRSLSKALDARLNFTANIGITCPFGSGACRVTAHVTNTVITDPDVVGVSGKVRADMTAYVTGPLNSATCRDSRSMRVNSSATMSCVVVLALPQCNRRGVCTWPVRGIALVTAHAKVNLTVLRRQLRRDRDREKDEAECRSGAERCEHPVKGSKAGADALKADVDRLRRKRGQRQCDEGTVAVVRVAKKFGDGTTKKLVAAESPTRPFQWTDNDLGGMEFVPGKGHAEATIVNWLKHHGDWYIVEGHVQRNICQPGEAPNCPVSCVEILERRCRTRRSGHLSIVPGPGTSRGSDRSGRSDNPEWLITRI